MLQCTVAVVESIPHQYMCACVKVVSALCYLDSIHYIIHRDVAARNFLVTDCNRIKLADFGRARYVPDDDNYRASKSEMVCIKWSSPEVLIRSCYSTRSDIWAAGVVMWEILTAGQRPYSGLTAEQAAVYVLSRGRLDQPDNCPYHLYTVMASCWQHKPTDRPSATELADRLRERSLAMLQPSLMGVAESLSYRKQTSSSSLYSSFVTAFEKSML